VGSVQCNTGIYLNNKLCTDQYLVVSSMSHVHVRFMLALPYDFIGDIAVSDSNHNVRMGLQARPPRPPHTYTHAHALADARACWAAAPADTLFLPRGSANGKATAGPRSLAQGQEWLHEYRTMLFEQCLSNNDCRRVPLADPLACGPADVHNGIGRDLRSARVHVYVVQGSLAHICYE
jgi:hypothetical protein